MRSRTPRTQLLATVIGLIAAVMVAPVSHAVAIPDAESPAAATERRHPPVEVVHNAVTDPTNGGGDLVDHTTDALDDVVDHTTDAVDHAVDRLSGGDSGVREPQPPELPPDSDGDLGVSAAPSTPGSPSPTAPRAAGPSGEPSPANGDLDGPDGGANGRPQPTPGDPGSLFNGAGGIGERAPFPLALIAALLAFLGVQGWVDRRDPKLTAAPVGAEADLVFERP